MIVLKYRAFLLDPLSPQATKINFVFQLTSSLSVVHKNTKKLGPYLAIIDSLLVNIYCLMSVVIFYHLK